jgi:hypothetical protein
MVGAVKDIGVMGELGAAGWLDKVCGHIGGLSLRPGLVTHLFHTLFFEFSGFPPFS